MLLISLPLYCTFEESYFITVMKRHRCATTEIQETERLGSVFCRLQGNAHQLHGWLLKKDSMYRRLITVENTRKFMAKWHKS